MIMNTLKKLPLFIIIFSLLTAIPIIYNLYYNINLICSFKNVENIYNYTDALRQGTIDLDEISNLFTDNIALIGYPDLEDTVISPVRIEYYDNKEDNSPVYVVEKGEIIHFELFPKTKSGLKFRGNDSIPSDSKGWRLAKPFIVNGNQNDSLLYVKLDDLVCVTNEWLENNPSLIDRYSTEVLKNGLTPTKHNISKTLLLFVDYKLYSNGVFLSKDIKKPVFDTATLLNLLITIILSALYILTKTKTFKKH